MTDSRPRGGQVQPRHRRRRASGGIELQGHDAGDDPAERLLAQRPGRRHGAVQRAGLRRVDRQCRGRWGRHDHRPGDDRVGERAFHVCPPAWGSTRSSTWPRSSACGRSSRGASWSTNGGSSFTLGVISVTPLEMANITATIAGDGVHRPDLRLGGGARRQGPVRRDRPSRARARPRRRPLCSEHPPRPARRPQWDRIGQGDSRGTTRSARPAPTTTRSARRSSVGRRTSRPRRAARGMPTRTSQAPGSVPASRMASGGFMIPALRGTADAPFPAPGPACAPGKFVDPVLGRTTDVAPPAPPPAPGAGRPPPAPRPTAAAGVTAAADRGGGGGGGGGGGDGGRGGGRGGD